MDGWMDGWRVEIVHCGTRFAKGKEREGAECALRVESRSRVTEERENRMRENRREYGMRGEERRGRRKVIDGWSLYPSKNPANKSFGLFPKARKRQGRRRGEERRRRREKKKCIE